MARSLIIVVLSFIWATLISAQGVTDVTCNVTSVNQWAFNAEKQSPCQVAANLGAVCATTGTYTIDALSPAFEHYYTPSPLATACECSSVIYSLAAACGLCQGGTFTTWLIWQGNCTSISPSTFPFSIPPNTFVPAWAYQDVQSTNSFSPATAQTVGDEPESSPVAAATPQPTQSSSQNPTNNPTSSAPTGSSTPAPAPASSHKSSNTGAIAGGVVGGVAVIAILGALIFFIAKSKKKRAAQNGSDTQEFARNSEKYEPTTPGRTTAYSPPPFSPGTDHPQNYMNKPYDPNDPSTFPMSTGSPNPSATQYNQSPYPHTVGGNSQYGQYTPDHTSMVGGGTPAPHQPGQYSGVAEV